MNTYVIISVFSFAAVAAIVATIWSVVVDRLGTKSEQRLRDVRKGNEAESSTILREEAVREGLAGLKGLALKNLLKVADINGLFRQAGTTISAAKFLLICTGFGLAGFTAMLVSPGSAMLAPPAALGAAALPVMWLLARRRRRLKQFSRQLPDALQLIARALRAGHSLPMAMRCIGDEMRPPVAAEFAQVTESVALGLSYEQALGNLAQRVPNRELEFFVTAVNMQRQLGGDLAEILEKIADIVRQRFQILGHVQSLTGEGRISGVVLMVLPIILFFTLYMLNPEYVMVLFEDEMGRKMLGGAVVLQILGAFAIKKIVDIDV